jgi:hypothetical protein
MICYAGPLNPDFLLLASPGNFIWTPRRAVQVPDLGNNVSGQAFQTRRSGEKIPSEQFYRASGPGQEPWTAMGWTAIAISSLQYVHRHYNNNLINMLNKAWGMFKKYHNRNARLPHLSTYEL